MINVYDAAPYDVEEIATLAERFFAESNFYGNLTLAPEGWRKTLRENITNPNARAIIAVDTETMKIVGYVLIYVQNDYTVENIGELFQFYVAPEYRKTQVARLLVQAAVNQFDAWECARCYAEASPGLADPAHLQLFINLWGKFGYVQTGVTLMRERKDQ